MTAEKVRLSILQQAIQGKLTKQCHNENAIEHLKRIHAYNKSIQEQDFEIPNNWAWAKLADLTTDNSLNDGNWILSKDMSTAGTINLIQLGSVGDCVFKPKDYKRITEKKFTELQCREIYPGYLLINRLIGDRLLSCILPQIEGRLITAVDVCWVAPQPQMYNLKYIMYMCASPFFQSQVKALGHGTTRFRISKTNLINIAFPYPPIEEQARIVELFESVESYLVKCEEKEKRLVLLNATFPEMMKKSILQEAVQGKLVPQDPKDEPASVLLKKIAEEKKRLIKEGKIKKQKPLPEITEDEIPFDIPESWEWVRLAKVGMLQTGTTPSKAHPEYYGEFIPFVSPGDISMENVLTCRKDGLSKEGLDYARLIPAKSVLQVCIGGSIGKAAINDVDVTCNQQINTITPYLINEQYLFYCMTSDLVVSQIKANAGGTATPIINKSIWGNIIIPIAPLNEQRRVVAKLEEILSEIRALCM